MKPQKDLMERIDINPKILAGKPVIKGTRIPVYLIMDLLSFDCCFKEIIRAYPELQEKDIQAAKYFTEVKLL